MQHMVYHIIGHIPYVVLKRCKVVEGGINGRNKKTLERITVVEDL